MGQFSKVRFTSLEMSFTSTISSKYSSQKGVAVSERSTTKLSASEIANSLSLCKFCWESKYRIGDVSPEKCLVDTPELRRKDCPAAGALKSQ
jgi:hypothetical protein